MTIHFYVKDMGDGNCRPIWYDDEGNNFWYDIETPFEPYHYFWFPESEGYVKLFFIGEGYKVPDWVKQGCGWG